MNWFGRKSAGRADARPVLARGWSIAQSERPWTYEDAVRSGYLANPVVQRAVRLVVLADADATALAGGANLAMLGGEAIQYGHAQPLGGAMWRLSELYRGRCGTEATITGHEAGESFALIEPATMRILAVEDAMTGAVIDAQGVGDALPIVAALATAGRALLPLSPVKLSAERVDEGFRVTWIRRSRDGFAWRDGVEVPIAEEQEAYRLMASGGGAELSAEVNAPEWLLPGDFAPAGAIVTVSVQQIGRAGLSEATTITVEI
ncbi:hypothetical protein SPAN111604_07910 [Sphingomonas antarctica]|uniref:GTA baseplate fiber-binding domain-containing protein n=1 Tax=Sphingomonas antarctica TaxID=2040274 RepID=UPI0039ECFBEA